MSKLALSDKMKIKKEKTKYLLGEKTKRMNFEYSNKIQNDALNLNEEADSIKNKINQIKENSKSNNFRFNLNDKNYIQYIGNSNFINCNKLSVQKNKINYENFNNKIIEFPKIQHFKYSINKEKEFNSESDFDLCSDLAIQEGEDYIIENEKLIILNDNLDEKTKKEIKILRNRISAQKSRDRKKFELRQFKQFSNTLYCENENLKNRLSENEEENLNLKKCIKHIKENLCERCQNLKNYEPKKFSKCKVKSNNILNDIDFNKRTDKTIIQNPNIIDISSASRRNFSTNLKVGVFSSILVILFVFGCILWGQLDKLNSTITRQLFSLYDGNLIKANIKSEKHKNHDGVNSENNPETNNKSNNIHKIFNVTKYYPIVKFNKNLTNYTVNSYRNKKYKKANKNKLNNFNNDSNFKALDKLNNKIADYNIYKYNYEILKNFLNRKKNEFLGSISNKIYDMTLGLNKALKGTINNNVEIGYFSSF